MAREGSAALELSRLDDDVLLDSLIEYIASGSVVPVVGRDLLRVPDSSGSERCLYTIIAEQLATSLKPPVPVPSDDANPLGAVASQFILNGGNPQLIYRHLHRILEQRRPLLVPETLRKLASIQPFRLFVTATFDPLLAQAIEEVRGAAPHVVSYAPGMNQGPLDAVMTEAEPVVFHLLGRVSPISNYVVTEEDAFEFMFSLLSSNRVEQLSDLLGRKKLLIIGCRFPSWLVRFFLRVARGRRLLSTVDRTDFVVDPSAGENPELVQFLQNFRTQTEIFTSDPVSFVNELEKRWRSYLRSTKGPVPDAMQPCAVFISYAHEDAHIAEQVARQIEENGPPVWLDRRELGAGDEWERKITKNIEVASVFVPLLSRACLQPGPRYFRAEWNCALRLADRWSDPSAFLLPLAIEQVPHDSTAIPEPLRKQQWSVRGPDGALPADFIERLRQGYKTCQLRRRG